MKWALKSREDNGPKQGKQSQSTFAFGLISGQEERFLLTINSLFYSLPLFRISLYRAILCLPGAFPFSPSDWSMALKSFLVLSVLCHKNISLMRHVQLAVDWSLYYIPNNWLSIHPSSRWLSCQEVFREADKESLQGFVGTLGLLPKEPEKTLSWRWNSSSSPWFTCQYCQVPKSNQGCSCGVVRRNPWRSPE